MYVVLYLVCSAVILGSVQGHNYWSIGCTEANLISCVIDIVAEYDIDIDILDSLDDAGNIKEACRVYWLFRHCTERFLGHCTETARALVVGLDDVMDYVCDDGLSQILELLSDDCMQTPNLTLEVEECKRTVLSTQQGVNIMMAAIWGTNGQQDISEQSCIVVNDYMECVYDAMFGRCGPKLADFGLMLIDKLVDPMASLIDCDLIY